MNPEIIDPLPAVPEMETVSSETAALELETLRAELARQIDLHLHLAADFENFKRRSRAEADVRAAAQKDGFIQELLSGNDFATIAKIAPSAWHRK